MEGQWANKTGNLISLSEQNIVDCAGPFGNIGCLGGYPASAMEYVHFNGGIDTEIEYPYVAKDQKCNYNPKNSGVVVQGVVNITNQDCDGLFHAVGTIGPISICIDASEFQFYSGGIYSSTSCSKIVLDHAVLLVGYSSSPDGQNYYILKNSWGTTWGIEGYMYFSRDIPNMCGICEKASFPLV